MKQKGKRIAAIDLCDLTCTVYVATLVVSLLDFEGSDQLFASCIVAIIVLPILLWVYIWLYGKITRKGYDGWICTTARRMSTKFEPRFARSH